MNFFTIIFLLSFPLWANDTQLAKDIQEALSLKNQMARMGFHYDIDELASSYFQNSHHSNYESFHHQDEREVTFIPFDLDRGDIAKVSIAAGAAIILFSSDEEVARFAREHKTEVTQVISDIGERYGAGVEAVLASSAGYVLGVVMKKDRIRSVSLIALKSMFMSGLVTRAIKTTMRRKRPNATDDAHEWNGDLSDHSFPSGHTTLAFSIGTFIAESTKGYSKILPVLAYAASTVAGISRVHDEAHWASDVVIGALIGHLVTKNIMKKGVKRNGLYLSTYLTKDGNPVIGFQYRRKENNYSGCEKAANPIRACLRRAAGLE